MGFIPIKMTCFSVSPSPFFTLRLCLAPRVEHLGRAALCLFSGVSLPCLDWHAQHYVRYRRSGSTQIEHLAQVPCEPFPPASAQRWPVCRASIKPLAKGCQRGMIRSFLVYRQSHKDLGRQVFIDIHFHRRSERLYRYATNAIFSTKAGSKGGLPYCPCPLYNLINCCVKRSQSMICFSLRRK